MTSDHHSSSVELYSDSRCDHQDFESSRYNNQMAMNNTPCSSNMVQTSSSSSLDHMGRKRDGKWSQFLSKDAFNSFSSFPNQGAIPYPPSKVSIVTLNLLLLYVLSLILRLMHTHTCDTSLVPTVR